MKKNDLILAAAALAAALTAGGVYHITHQAPAVFAEVSSDGEVIERLDISKDQEITVSGNEGTNRLVIEDGTIRCSDASCPDKLCVTQGKKSLNGDVIVCLPNKMIVTIIGNVK